MTLPRWFGRKTRKKSGKKNNEIQEKACEYKSNSSQDATICPNEYFDNETIGQQRHLLKLDTFRPTPEVNYVQEQDIYGIQLKEVQESQLKNEIHNTSNSSYKNRENGIHTCSNNEREKQNLMSLAIYGGR
jgi:hypothetical protein